MLLACRPLVARAPFPTGSTHSLSRTQAVFFVPLGLARRSPYNADIARFFLLGCRFIFLPFWRACRCRHERGEAPEKGLCCRVRRNRIKGERNYCVAPNAHCLLGAPGRVLAGAGLVLTANVSCRGRGRFARGVALSGAVANKPHSTVCRLLV